MAKIVINYKSIDPDFSDQTQTFISEDTVGCWKQKKEFDNWIGKDYPDGVNSIYKTEVVTIKP